VVDFCEPGNELSDSIRAADFLLMWVTPDDITQTVDNVLLNTVNQLIRLKWDIAPYMFTTVAILSYYALT
jgi:hypothetical protein